MAKVSTVLPDQLRPGLALVFCGTAAGRKSALEGAYYAHGQNKFWQTLHAVGLTPRLFAPQDFPLLDALDIGLTDIAKFTFGMDHQLPKEALGAEAAEALCRRIAKFAPRHLAFTSLNAGRAVMGKTAKAGLQPERLSETQVWILPSPSPLAGNHWDVAPWKQLAKAILAEADSPSPARGGPARGGPARGGPARGGKELRQPRRKRPAGDGEAP